MYVVMCGSWFRVMSPYEQESTRSARWIHPYDPECLLQPGWLKSGDSQKCVDGEVCFWEDRAPNLEGGASYFARIHLENVIYRYLTLPVTWFEMISADICRFLHSPLFNQPGGCEILSCAWNLKVFNQEGGQLKVSGSSFAVKGDLHSLCLAPLHSHTISCTRRMSLDNPLD